MNTYVANEYVQYLLNRDIVLEQCRVCKYFIRTVVCVRLKWLLLLCYAERICYSATTLFKVAALLMYDEDHKVAWWTALLYLLSLYNDKILNLCLCCATVSINYSHCLLSLNKITTHIIVSLPLLNREQCDLAFIIPFSSVSSKQECIKRWNLPIQIQTRTIVCWCIDS